MPVMVCRYGRSGLETNLPSQRIHTMRVALIALVVALAAASAALAQQKKTEETRTETQTNTDSTSGRTVKTSSVTTISKTEDVTPLENAVTTNPFSYYIFYNISYMHAITPMIAVGGGVDIPTAFAPGDMSGFGINLEGRFYLGRHPFHGFFLNPVISFHSLTYTPSTYDGPTIERVHDTPFSIGAYMGWHWYPWDEFMTQIAFGADWNISKTTDESLIGLGSDRTGLVPGLRFGLGYAW